MCEIVAKADEVKATENSTGELDEDDLNLQLDMSNNQIPLMDSESDETLEL